MKNIPLLDEMIKSYDCNILKHLTNIKSTLISGKDAVCLMRILIFLLIFFYFQGFILEFYFSKNEYFTNEVLQKQYFFNYDLSDDQPFDYEGPEIIRAKGYT